MPPAARVTDMHVCPMITPGVPPIPHVGGPIMPPGAPTVLIGFLPAATVTSMAVCVGPPDTIVKGSAGVFINFMPAARMGDTCAHGGTIVLGFPTVMIGEVGSGSPGAGGMGGLAAGLAASGVSNPIDPNASVLATPGTRPAPSAAELATTPVNGMTPVRVLPGTNGKVAVIGRSMAGTVNPYSDGLKAAGFAPETFNGDMIPASAQVEWDKLKADYKPLIPDDVLKESQMFKANVAWAQKLKAEGYTVVDMGDPAGIGPSVFYAAEQEILFGGLKP